MCIYGLWKSFACSIWKTYARILHLDSSTKKSTIWMTRICLFSFFFIYIVLWLFRKRGFFARQKWRRPYVCLIAFLTFSCLEISSRAHFPLANRWIIKLLLSTYASKYPILENIIFYQKNNSITRILMNSTKLPSHDPKTSQLLHYKTRYDHYTR